MTAVATEAARPVRRRSVLRFAARNRSLVLGGLLVAVLLLAALAAPLLAPADPLTQNLALALKPPSGAAPFGTDQFGRDLFSRVLYGARISLLEIILGVGLSVAFGVPLGLLAGTFGGRTDRIIMWLLDILFAFPGIVLAILLISVLGSSLINLLIAIAVFSVPIYGRLSRNLAMSLKSLEYVEAATALGAGTTRVVLDHILRNAAAPLIVQATLTAGTVILTAASLSFLGLGAQPPTPEWGAMMSDGRNYLGVSIYLSLFPGLAITLAVLGFNMVGDGLRDLLDPRR